MHPISVCIIAKNEEKRIERCLSSVKPCGFEIIVVDTGSTDKTRAIASRYADKVLDFTWCDDFSAARNFSLQAASNNWIFMMDCDEWIKSIDVEELNYFRKKYPDSVGAISRENLVTENGQLVLNNTDHTERFFNKKLYHYTGIIHEQLTPIHGNDFPCLLLHTTIEHTGYDMTPEQKIAKGKRNLSLLHKQLAKEPENPYVYYQIGKGYEIIEDYDSACKYYGKGLYFDVDPSLAYVQAMVISYGNTLLLTNQYNTALQFERIYDTFATTADFIYLMGRIYMANEKYPQAIEQFYKATTMQDCKFYGANSFLCYYHIGLICETLGDTANAYTYYKKCGNYSPAIQKLTSLSASELTNKKRIVLFENDNFILKYIMEQYHKAFNKLGYETFVFPKITNSEEFQHNAEKMFRFHEQGLDAVITFNNRGFQMQFDKRLSLWDKWNVPCYNILVDHPMYYYDTLDDSPEQGIVVCSDRNHQAYVNRFYPSVKKTLFLPTAGEELHRGSEKKAIEERSIDVLFIGGLKYHAEYQYDDLDRHTMDYLIQHPDETVEHAIEIILSEASLHMPDVELKKIIQNHRFIETNISSLYRLEIIRLLLDAGITVTVYGNGWENTDIYMNPYFICHSTVPFKDGLALMEDSKIVLNQLSWFKDGGSERIFNAMLQKAVCVTDDSTYLREILAHQKSVVFYSLNELEKLPGLIKELLNQPAKMQQIADCGYQTAQSNHTWEKRAEQLSDIIASS